MRLAFCFSRKLQAVSDDLRLAVLAVLAGSEVALFDGALVAEALCPLEEQLHAFAAAKAADCILCIVPMFFSFSMDRFTGLAILFVPIK